MNEHIAPEQEKKLLQAIAAWNRRADARQLALKTRVCPMCEDCPDGCPVETPKDSRNIITNADRIRSMSDKELAVFFAKVNAALCRADLPIIAYRGETVNDNLDWLWQPAETEGAK